MSGNISPMIQRTKQEVSRVELRSGATKTMTKMGTKKGCLDAFGKDDMSFLSSLFALISLLFLEPRRRNQSKVE